MTLLLLVISALACRKVPESIDQKIFSRIEYVYSLKPTIASDIWPDFNKSRYDVPLIYYTDTSSLVANPTKRFLNSYNPKLVYQNGGIRIYKVSERIDNIPFHMATGFTMGDSSAYDNYTPFVHSSGYEETRKVVQDISSTEEWVTMVIHEYFHGFQYKHDEYLRSLAQNIFSVPQDSLRDIYRNNEWFKEKVDRENELLLLALETESRTKIDSLISTFLKLRKQRRKETKQRLGFDIESYEKTYETMEGTARYVEQKLYERFSDKLPDSKLISSDTSYHSYSYFKDYELDKEEWLYLPSKSAVYYYATGFNMARLLDKLKVKYKERLFNEGELSMEEIVKTL
ncbi:hypothetical protein [Pontibacter akesuensis]|uniref:hypothetical protein n=1 Tax=Pontibacter akesuensis TaxID=388950 RepID=UPI001113C05B|nr:hypothetical protein [Pontibacter akesuensis]